MEATVFAAGHTFLFMVNSFRDLVMAICLAPLATANKTLGQDHKRALS
jgi:hypothetical protein